MVLRLLIDSVHPDETRVAIVDNGRINDFDFVTSAKKQVKGNIYLAKITRVEPSLQAAFVEYGSGKQGFLPFAEIHPDYYQIPTADRERLLKEAEAEAQLQEESAPLPQENKDTVPQEPVAEPEPEEIFLRAEQKIISDLQEYPSEPAEPPALQEKSAPPQEAAVITETTPTDADMAEKPIEAAPELVETQEVETLANEEDAVRQSRSGSFYRRYKIQEVIKRNQIVLVQVIKEERGNKGVSLTTFISLAGRYCVLMPNSPKGGGISRKISSGEDRRRLKEISSELKTARGMSAIIRTAGIDRSRAEIQRDYEYLVKLWETIREQTLSSTAPALIYEEGDLINRTIRDLYSTDIEEIIVAGETGFEHAKNFLDLILPGNNTNIKLYTDNVPLFYAYNIEDQLNSMYDQSVKLRSGGYIVLNPTEALISIDVNSGRSTGERNIEETATKTNLEAAYEIARQLRLRDLAGLIVIDFIDMADSRNRRAIERALKDALKMDRAKIQLGRISPFGLLEMSRQRLRPSISETSTMQCPHCLGKGVIRSNSSVALQAIRALEKEAATGVVEIKLFVTAPIALDILNNRRDALSAIEHKYAIRITTVTDESLSQGNFRIEKLKSARRNNPGASAQTPVSMNQAIMEGVPSIEENASVISENIVGEEMPPAPVFFDERPRRNRRGGRGKRGPKNYNEPRNPEQGNIADAPQSEAAEGGNSENNTPREDRPHRRRPRRWRDKRDRRPDHPNAANQTSDNNAPQFNQSAHTHNPAPQNTAQKSVPPLEQQAPQDSKPKKGWWRRIVEA